VTANYTDPLAKDVADFFVFLLYIYLFLVANQYFIALLVTGGGKTSTRKDAD